MSPSAQVRGRYDTMFSEALKSSAFLEIREVIIPSPRSAQVRSGYDTMFSEALKSSAFLEIREVIIHLREARKCEAGMIQCSPKLLKALLF